MYVVSLKLKAFTILKILNSQSKQNILMHLKFLVNSSDPDYMCVHLVQTKSSSSLLGICDHPPKGSMEVS